MAPWILPATDVRQKFSHILNEPDRHNEPLYITVRSHPRAVLVAYEFFETLMEKMEDLEDSLAYYERRDEPERDFDEFLAEVKGGETIPTVD